MCLAIPCRIVSRMDDETALVELAGNRRRISLALTPAAREGDWVLVHVGVAIQVLDEEQARASLAAWRQVWHWQQPACAGRRERMPGADQDDPHYGDDRRETENAGAERGNHPG